MGGSGSGRPGWRPLAEQSLAFRIGRLKRALDMLDDPKLDSVGEGVQWTTSNGGRVVASIRYLVRRGAAGPLVELQYAYRGEEVRDLIPVVTTQPHYGGRRWWWICPRCGRRVGVLYAPGKLWRCRWCYRITYTSSNESRQYDRLARMIGADPALLKLLYRRNW